MRARAIAKLLNDTDMAIIDKRRPRANVSQVMHIIGDVAGRDCVLVDDMIDTGGTLCKAAEALKERGAKRVFAYATHPIFSGNAVDNIKNSVIDEVIVCDTIPLSPEIKALKNVRTLTLSGMLAEAIRRISNEESISRCSSIDSSSFRCGAHRAGKIACPTAEKKTRWCVSNNGFSTRSPT